MKVIKLFQFYRHFSILLKAKPNTGMNNDFILGRKIFICSSLSDSRLRCDIRNFQPVDITAFLHQAAYSPVHGKNFFIVFQYHPKSPPIPPSDNDNSFCCIYSYIRIVSQKKITFQGG